MEIINWTDYFIEVAKTASLRSNCLRAQVGAVIVAPDKTVKATGYNGTPSKVTSCAERNFCYRVANNIPSGTRYETCRSIHAEQNAIIQAGKERAEGCTMYIYGHDFICILCKRFIVQSGISEVFLRKNMSSPVLRVTADELRRQLDESDYEPLADAKASSCDC